MLADQDGLREKGEDGVHYDFAAGVTYGGLHEPRDIGQFVSAPVDSLQMNEGLSMGEVMSKRRAVGWTDDECLKAFMHSFHVLSQKSYWREVRQLGRVDIHGEVTFKQDADSALVLMRGSRMDEVFADLAGAFHRKFITDSDPMSLGRLVAAGARKMGSSDSLSEAKFQWEQISEKPFEFYVQDGRVMTWKLPGVPDDWIKVGSPLREPKELVVITIREFALVYFYDGFLHAMDHRKGEGSRKLVRSIPQQVQTVMSRMAVSGSIYATTILHYLLREAEPSWCPEVCQEASIMASLAARD